MRIFVKRALVVLSSVACVVGLLSTVGSTSASAAATTQICKTVLAGVQGGLQTSPVASHTCTWVTPAAATAHRAALGSSSGAKPLCGCETLLVAFFGNINYGPYEDDVWGKDGPCDSSGYGFASLAWTNSNVGHGGVSSYKLYNKCNVSEKWSGYSWTGSTSNLIWGANQSYVGDAWNDKIKSFWVLAG